METVLVVDIESGSVATALVRLAPGQQPKLFAENRILLPLARTLDAHALARAVEKAVREALAATSLTAARLRLASGGDAKLKEKLSRMGQVNRAALFFAPPWAALEERHGTLHWSRESSLARAVRSEIETLFGDIPVAEFASGEAAAGVLYSLFEQPSDILLCTVGGEVSELIHLAQGAPHAHATIPMGSHMLLRTLGTHAGLTHHEARSALTLARHHQSDLLAEPLHAAASDFSQQFATTARVMNLSEPIDDIVVLAPEPAGEWFARALSQMPSGEPFSAQSAVRAMHTHHLTPHIAVHAARPDLVLMTEAAFIDTVPPGVY